MGSMFALGRLTRKQDGETLVDSASLELDEYPGEEPGTRQKRITEAYADHP